MPTVANETAAACGPVGSLGFICGPIGQEDLTVVPVVASRLWILWDLMRGLDLIAHLPPS